MQPPEHAFLIRVAELLHVYGTPAHRLERVLVKVARTLGVEADFFSTPTSLFASLGRGESKRVHLVRVSPGEVNLGKLIEFDQVMEDVEGGRETSATALSRLEAIASAPPRYPTLVTALAFGVASAGAATFFGGGLSDLVLALVFGFALCFLGRLLEKSPEQVGVFEPLASFLVGFLSLVVTRTLLPADDRIVTLAGLIVLLPGLTLTVSLIDLATRHWVSGTARLAGAAAIFLTILFGVALAWRLGDAILPVDARPHATVALPAWSEWVAVACVPIAFAVILEARVSEIPVILAIAAAGYAAGRYGSLGLGADLGPFLGALVVGVLSNLYARVLDHPALVPSTPGILFLVPGSLGYRSLTSFLEREALQGAEWAFQTGLVAASLVGGLLAANVVLPPRRVL